MTSVAGWTFRVVVAFFILDLYSCWVVPLAALTCLAIGHGLSIAVKELGHYRVDGTLIALTLSAVLDQTRYLGVFSVTPSFTTAAVAGTIIYALYESCPSQYQVVSGSNNVMVSGNNNYHSYGC
ncbi:hypothetical protein QKT49_gp357 [Acanthamoeba castellanii medusavirus]|uniref:Uncharacterized protein n=1 Tax=Acanthamoeba castellanii medusavirus J1 TaxID=3114988 RepID=A0A3T1CX53_9VIRU|nr:hypothetical protein QKT49_gp357 [Acanthamoeba castellanii medusavirus]BBI30406.1 hypothetical protein [Acanthamoeba castellanii medusavirus J1]